MKVVYVAHPVSGDAEGNIQRALRWIEKLEEAFPVAVVASWVQECMIWDDDNPDERRAAMERDLAVIEKCDEIWLVGPRISDGMRHELSHAIAHGKRWRDFTVMEEQEPPDVFVWKDHEPFE